jgi:hypothetical protein
MEGDVMGKKLEGNGMWESSRMMLPEHREAILDQTRQLKRIEKPILDEQEIAMINAAFQNSLYNKCMLIISHYGAFEVKTIRGTALVINNRLKMIKIKYEDPSAESDECIWISMNDVLKAETQDVSEWDGEFLDW